MSGQISTLIISTDTYVPKGLTEGKACSKVPSQCKRQEKFGPKTEKTRC